MENLTLVQYLPFVVLAILFVLGTAMFVRGMSAISEMEKREKERKAKEQEGNGG